MLLFDNKIKCGFDYERGHTHIYKVGAHIAHPGHGGCTIQEICYRNHNGEKTRYFILIPECDPNTKIMVPVENVDKIGLREVISSKEADQILLFLANTEVSWDSDHKQRKESYDAAMRGSDLLALAKMIKELLVQEKQASLGNFEKEALPRAQKRLFSEIALAKGVCFDETVRMACRSMLA